MVEYRRNNEELKVALREHSILGYPVKVPTFGKAIGVQTATSRDITGVLVDLVKPMPLDEMAEKYGWSGEKWNLRKWREELRPYTSSTTPAFQSSALT